MTASAATELPVAKRARGPLVVLGTDVLEPRTWIIAVTLLMGWYSGRLPGVAWGLLASFLCGVVPMLWIKWGQRRGYWGDRHVRRRQDRLIVLPGVIVSVASCITLMLTLDAPRELTAVVMAMLATLIAILAITTAWKVSVHTAVASGAVVLTALAYGPWVLAAYPLVWLVGWSRVAVRDHTLAQVLVGTALGAGLAGAVYSWLS
ncbi:phosphatase PAP2 family protein [Streptomyces lavendulae]|uniref:phosphatase PAP2 family protein n=1 Tax=Streptomyces lavendulae TaxID=1914 RepID=UPI003682D4D6